jgi:hypothetical protein
MRASTTTLWRRLVWFAGLWLASVITLGAVSTVIRAWLQ